MSRGSPELEWAAVGFWPAMGLCGMLYRLGMDEMSTRSIWGLSLIGEEEESATALGSLRRPAMWWAAAAWKACANPEERCGWRRDSVCNAWRQWRCQTGAGATSHGGEPRRRRRSTAPSRREVEDGVKDIFVKWRNYRGLSIN